MLKVSIIRKRDLRRLSSRDVQDVHISFLCDDYEGVHFVKKSWPSPVSVDPLDTDFAAALADVRSELLSAWGRLNARYSSSVWWSGQLASKNVWANAFAKNVVYYFLAKRVIMEEQRAVIFVVDSPALAGMVAAAAGKTGRPVEKRLHRERSAIVRLPVFWARIIAKCAIVIRGIINRCLAARRIPSSGQDLKLPSGRVVLIRTWITEGNFDKAGRFSERDFGELPERLIRDGYYVLTLPMFFNLKRPISDIYRLLASMGRHVVFPEKYLTLGDYLRNIQDALRLNLTRVSGLIVKGEDLSPLMNEVLERSGFDVSLVELNAASYLLSRLKARGLDLSMAVYPFEGNAPEHPFILAVRSSFPQAKIVGYQHTALSQNQLACYLADEEALVRPLPDRIVCSGPAYTDFLMKNGFPGEILLDGPNLRFTQVHLPVVGGTGRSGVLLPLTFSYALAFDLFLKVRGALRGRSEFRVFVRSHPLLDRRKLKSFLNEIGAEWEFADEGLVQDWFRRVGAMITTGASITTLEAVVAGIPVVRVAPSLVFHHNCLHLPDYPVPIAYSIADIRDRLELVDRLLLSDPEVFARSAREALEAYFCRTDDSNIRVFSAALSQAHDEDRKWMKKRYGIAVR